MDFFVFKNYIKFIYINNLYHVPFIDPALALFILNVVPLLGQVEHFVESLATEQVLQE
jgi:hypothetical protein